MVDTQKERRNFEGYRREQYYSMSDIVCGDCAGTTETDSQTDSPSGGYTGINKTSGKVKDWGGKKLSADTAILGPDVRLQYGKESG